MLLLGFGLLGHALFFFFLLSILFPLQLEARSESVSRPVLRVIVPHVVEQASPKSIKDEWRLLGLSACARLRVLQGAVGAGAVAARVSRKLY